MVEEHRPQLGLVLGQSGERRLRHLGERRVGGREDRERALLREVPARPDFFSSAASVVNFPAAFAVATMFFGGISTLLMTWMTPFEAITSGVVTFARFTKTPPSLTLIRTELPSRVLAELSLTTSEAVTLPETTW